jgi:glycosyltransferase involved in cell wall biosynthesis
MRGGQHQVRLLLTLLEKAGIEVNLLAREGSALEEEARKRKLPVAAATVRNVFIHSCGSDLTHVHDARAHTMAAIACTKPIIVSRRVAFPVKSGMMSRWKYGRAARFLAVSQYVAEQLKTAGIPSQKIEVVPDAFEPRAQGVWDARARAVALGSNDRQKGRDLIEAAARRAKIAVEFSELLPRDLSRASMFVYITRSEGLGSAAIMAMQMGIPVIASRVGGLAEVFEHELSGLYTENTPEAIGRAMRRIVEEQGLAERLIAEGKVRAAEKFSPEILVSRTIALYREALGE